MFRRSRFSKSISQIKEESTPKEENGEKTRTDKLLLKAHLKLDQVVPHFKEDI